MIYFRCPTCLAVNHVPDSCARNAAACSQCQQPLIVPDPPPDPANRTRLASVEPPDSMIRYTCPRCTHKIKSPSSALGQKVICPRCRQKILVVAPLPENKTVIVRAEEPQVVPPVPVTVVTEVPAQVYSPPVVMEPPRYAPPASPAPPNCVYCSPAGQAVAAFLTGCFVPTALPAVMNLAECPVCGRKLR